MDEQTTFVISETITLEKFRDGRLVETVTIHPDGSKNVTREDNQCH